MANSSCERNEEDALLMLSTLEIRGQACDVKLTQEEIQWSSAGLGGVASRARRLGKNIKQAIRLSDIVAVVAATTLVRSKACFNHFLKPGPGFAVFAVRRVGKYVWRQHKTVFHHSDPDLANQWIAQINAILMQPEFRRPRSLLVFVNPISGKKRGMKIYHSKVAPLFELAGISTVVICTERQNHAHDTLLAYDLEKFDGIVSVGGDGMFSEIVNGLMMRSLKCEGIGQVNIETVLPRPKWRVGIIPAGSTDAVVYSCQGSNDPITSALHIIIGDRLGMDIGTLFHNENFMRFSISFLGYGYYGDCIVDSEQERWMGPRRYDWEGFRKVLTNRSYSGEISFLPSSNSICHPRDGLICAAGCEVCNQTISLQHSSALETGDQPSAAVQEKESSSSSSGWQTVRGEFMAVNAFMVSCRCRYALEGPAPAAHLGDGCTDLVLVHRCSRFDYTRHLYRCSDPSKDQFDFRFVEAYRVSQFKFRPLHEEETELSNPSISPTNERQRSVKGSNATSSWNCDGEAIDQPSVECKIHRQLIQLFARGVEAEK